MNANPSAAYAERQLTRKNPVGPRKPGFAGPGHTAVEVFNSHAIAATDPFVLLMDDTLDFAPGQRVGEPHPHAGIETVTFMLEGSLNDRVEGLLETGDIAWMTAARGVIHNEDVIATGHARILQLWVALPESERNSSPELQIVRLASLLIRREPGVEARLYSGRSGTLESPTRNRVPMTVVDFLFQPKASIEQVLPDRYRALLYAVEGAVQVGGETIEAGEVGWIDPTDDAGTFIRLESALDGARLLLYAGATSAEALGHRGPFVAGSVAELSAQFAAYRSGRFRRISEIERH
jgi:redox-sensitive bicupin YhaK (pirin superfamily)